MKKMIIIDDRLEKGLSLCKQFHEAGYPICEFGYFCNDLKQGKKQIQKQEHHVPFPIRLLDLFDFEDVLTTYLKDLDTCIVMPFQLSGDGSDGIPMYRAGIRYVKTHPTDRIWFYTGAGRVMESILSKLVGSDQVLDVAEARWDYLRLDLSKLSFQQKAACHE